MVDKTRDDEEKKMDDKFILMGLDDENSKHVAEVLKSEKAKKILDFLGDTKEASEKDIAEGLDMPINTVEYNLKKLVKSGLVDKSKNFFWSVKGKKILMYKLAKKHIIIGTKKPSINYIRSILPAVLIAAVLIALILMFMFSQTPQGLDEGISFEDGLKQFASVSELKEYLKENSEAGVNMFGGRGEAWDGEVTPTIGMAESAAADSSQKAGDYSETNIQIEGVDEADIVKNDGKYIYVVSNNKVVIVDAYPADSMKILSEIKFDKNVRDIFVNDDKLVVFGSFYGRDKNRVYVYDISDKENPVKEQEIESDGYYQNSRMIGDYVYVITNKYVNVENPEPPVYFIDGVKESVAATDVYYWHYPEVNYVFTSIMAVNVESGEFESKVYLTGGAGTVYVSVDNIYLTNQKRINYEDYLKSYVDEVVLEVIPFDLKEEVEEIVDSSKRDYEKMSEINKIVYDYSLSLTGSEKAEFDESLNELNKEFEISISKKNEITLVHKININENEINYLGVGEVPGRVLNQFSMDESNGYFRIATTTGNSWKDTSLNHVYILNEDLEIVGSVEDLAKGEQIYSVRFIGDKAYMVTFKRVDPLFVIDLSNPTAPEVLGYLKITGFSNYLHPYNENILIGVGMEADEEGRVQGVKIGLFDVSDFENPREIDKYVVEGDYSYSEVQYEHKAFLFDRERNLLVIPVSYSYYADDWKDTEHWQGAFVFYINENGLTKRGQITHYEQDESDKGYYYWYPGVRRSLYMDDVLYTISGSKIKANHLIDLNEIKEVVYAEASYNQIVRGGGAVGVDSVSNVG